MAFYKVGDEAEILDCFDDNGNAKYCITCGRKMKVLAINTEDAELICEACEIKKENPKN